MALRLTERADLAVDRISANALEGIGLWGGTVVTVWVANRGRTRAINVYYEASLGIPMGDDAAEKSSSPPTVIAAGAEVPFGFRRFMEDFIPAKAIDRINTGQLELHISGKLTYDDLFDDHHTVEFSGVWNRERLAFETTKYDLIQESQV